MKGTIKKLTDKGFGFISSDSEEKDIFFHFSELKDVKFEELSEGEAVNFEVAESDRGLNATNITRA